MESWRGLEHSLRMLSLRDNVISNLPRGVFSSLQALEYLDLSGNSIAELDGELFMQGPPLLMQLFLADNQIKYVPYPQVATLRSLRTLDLSYNLISNLHSAVTEPGFHHKLSLDILRLDYNDIQFLPPGSFQHLDIVNKTYLNGNPLSLVQTDAFRDARIRELYLVDCGLQEISPSAFSGLEPSLQVLDLSKNNLTQLPATLLLEFDFLKTLNVRDNVLFDLQGSDESSAHQFQYSIHKLDLSGKSNQPVALQDLRRMRNLRSLIVSRLRQNHIGAEDFQEFSIDLEELKILHSNLKSIKSHAFKNVRGLKKLDLSYNTISSMDSEAFSDIGQSLTSLRLSHAFSGLRNIPGEAFKPLTNVAHLDLSYNNFQIIHETAFHYLRRVKILELQDNHIEQIHKGTFQGDIHGFLEELYLSFNLIKQINTHTFVDISSLAHLSLDDNQISRIERRAFINLDNLRFLNLKGNKIHWISDEAFQNLPELELLDLAYNQLKSFDFACLDQVGTLSSFRLNISYNEIRQLKANNSLTQRELMFHSNVKILDLSHNNVSSIAHGYFRPIESSITHLYLSHNSLLNATRDNFGNMPHLQWLDLSANLISEIDFDSFKNTRKLQILYLGYNQLTDIPSELFRSLSNLRVVDFRSNKLRSLPDSLFIETGLEYVSVAYNQLGRFPISSFSAAAASTLCHLDLSHNAIQSIHAPELLSRFRSLRELDLSFNRLVRFEDATFSSLSRLSSLELSSNPELTFEQKGRVFIGLETSLIYLGFQNLSMSYLPELPFTGLLYLQLSYNRLSNFPVELAMNLTSLRTLDLSHNVFSEIPLIVHSLPSLRTIVLSHNHIASFTNTTLLGGHNRLRELDITHLPVTQFEMGSLSKLSALKTLHISPYKSIRDFNLPKILEQNTALRNLHVEVTHRTNLEAEMRGEFPPKLRNITLSGQFLQSLDSHILQGIRFPRLLFMMRNTSVGVLPRSMFEHTGTAQNISLDIRNNSIHTLGNPSTADFLGVPRKTFLTQLLVAGNPWTCNCELGWIEVWQRKKRQFLCRSPDDAVRTTTIAVECLEAEDDLRKAECFNMKNESLIEVLKSDIECGWGAASLPQTTTFLLLLSLLITKFLIL
ncbi:unnamed protein product [Bemisia tabaci]|uniref:Chaoptin n=2 Tax=Bemisia tabaci TaxID=7038 RepID=A0A9P0AP80_BEMTA|nr:unnamed protein product [Bemisia tabaci]